MMAPLSVLVAWTFKYILLSTTGEILNVTLDLRDFSCPTALAFYVPVLASTVAERDDLDDLRQRGK